MRRWMFVPLLIGSCVVAFGIASGAEDGQKTERADLVLCCRADNDLYQVIGNCGVKRSRYDSPMVAVKSASEGVGVLLLADEYPDKPLVIDPAVFQLAAKKRLRLYVEYPKAIPGIELAASRGTRWERGVIASDAFGSKLKKMRIVSIHDCHFIPTSVDKPHMVLAKVAGFDTAVYGLPEKETWPILFEHPSRKVLVATTKLSQFVTARYAPTDAWGPVWRMILGWLRPDVEFPPLTWTPTVRPSHARDESFPADGELQAIRRGTEWVLKSRMLIDKSWHGRKFKTWDERFSLPMGDGSAGILEGFNSRIRYDGSQTVRANLRTDANLR